MSFCSECGSALNPDTQYCLECGTNATQSQAPSFDWEPQKFVSPIFGLILVCFFLPFVNLSCKGQKLMTLTGIQLVMGTTIEQPVLFGQRPPVQRVSGEPLAVLALLCAIVGLGLGLPAACKSFPAGPTIAGTGGTVLLLLLRSKLDSDALRETAGMLQVEYVVGFWLACLMFCAAAVAGIVFIGVKKTSIKSYSATALGNSSLWESDHANTHTGTYSCSVCGSYQKSDGRACADCGSPNPYGKPMKANGSSSAKLSNNKQQLPSLSVPFVALNNSFCSECGEQIGHQDKFCSDCGAQVV